MSLRSRVGRLRPSLTVESLLPLGLLLWCVGWFLPWVSTASASYWRGWTSTWGVDALSRTLDALLVSHRDVQWWHALGLVHGLALPALWCGPTTRSRARLWVAWSWWLGLVALGMLVVGRAEIPDGNRLAPGFWISTIGAALVGVPPVLALHRLAFRAARWARRPDATIDRSAASRAWPRLPLPLRSLVREAITLRSELGPHHPIDTDQSRMLSDLVGRLRRLGTVERSELCDRGVTCEGLLQRLAPFAPSRETKTEGWFDEMLRVDQALGHLTVAILAPPRTAPYR